MTTRAAPLKTAASEAVQPASIAALVTALVLSVLLIVVLGLVAAEVGLYAWESVGGAKPSPNQLTTMAWLVLMSGGVGGLAANRLVRRVFRIGAPGPIWYSCAGVALGAVPAGIWLAIHAANQAAATANMPTTAGATAQRLLTVMFAALGGVLVVAVRPYLRLVGASLGGTAVVVLAFAIVSLFAKNGNVRLGLLQFGALGDAEMAPSYFSPLFIEAAIAAALPATIVAWLGRHRDQPWGEAALAGVAGPFVVGLSYLIAGNGIKDTVDSVRPWLYVQAAAALAFLLAAYTGRMTARNDHIAVRPMPHRYLWWVAGAIVGALMGMIASIVFFNLGPFPFSIGAASEQVTGNMRTNDNSVLVSASATLIGLAVAIPVLIEAVWSVVASQRRRA
ncbi:hypothetical protein [Fodinicola acaciae]|uniref:hypothetical protein n=1 Tax=Fodinicola acaciae TaxID=2681555 RepID=UPI0013D67AB5|nr:hypothetical protein [Fodinicola acaciae]